MTALENLLIHYNFLPEQSTNKGVLRHLLKYLGGIQSYTIYDLADLCFTSPATVSRLVKTLGYRNYSDFQTSIADCMQSYDYHNRFCETGEPFVSMTPDRTVSDILAGLIREFERSVSPEIYMPLVEALHAADQVTMFPYGSIFMENALQSDLVYSGTPCEIVLSDHNQEERAASLRKGDLAIFMCPDAINAILPIRKSVRSARRGGAVIALITSSDSLSFLDPEDIVISCPGSRHMSDTFYTEMMLAAVDIAYRRKYIDKAGAV